ncbi:Coiled-coil domain-containing protein 65 [Bagarius yarrelli]|uniref:Dynein regulatory complex protein 1 n=1 Tax=Bagarius yarrelli TaxID=175774 RepID=A0A556VXZ0_BAGYA|nr:Coiled-coil domain-containing protein 65 [Bagarius yarrelli]
MNFPINLHKLIEKWRTNLRQAQIEELHEDFAILSQTLDTVVDCKENVMKLLMSELSEAEQQSEMAQRVHLQRVDHLLEIQKSRLAALESHWKSSVKELRTEYNTEREQLLKLHQQESQYAKAESIALQQRYAEIYSEAKQDYQCTCDDIKIQYIGIKHAVESTGEEMRQLHLQELQKYMKATEEQEEKFNSLGTVKKINVKTKPIEKLQGTINTLRSLLSSNQKENKEFVRDLRAECDEVAQQGETLVRLTDVCRKLETEQEKVLLFHTPSLNAEQPSQERAYAGKIKSKVLAQTMMDYTDLNKFWQRYNKVLLESLCFEREKKVLEQENGQLRILLKKYLDEVSVGDKQNPLLMLSSPSLQAFPASETPTHMHKTVTESPIQIQ